MDRLIFGVTLLAAVGAGLMAGVYFVFSAFAMKALGRLPPADGMAAMQSINLAIVNVWFMLVFLGTAAASVFLIIVSLLRWSMSGSMYLLIGGTLLLLGSFVLTIMVNVPMNDALAAARADSAGLALWSDYQARWTAWNHVRTVASVAACVSLALALAVREAK